MQSGTLLLVVVFGCIAVVLVFASTGCPPLQGNCRQDGELCPFDSTCASGVCYLGRCRSDLLGVSCTTNADCGDALVCSPTAKQCTLAVLGTQSIDMPCTRTAECAFGLYCDTNVCEDAIPLGGSCQRASDCAPQSNTLVICSAEQRCRALFTANVTTTTTIISNKQACEYDGNCQAGLEYCQCFYTSERLKGQQCVPLNASLMLCASEWQALASCTYTNQCPHWLAMFYYPGTCVYDKCKSELAAVLLCPVRLGMVPPACASYRQSLLDSGRSSSNVNSATTSASQQQQQQPVSTTTTAGARIAALLADAVAYALILSVIVVVGCIILALVLLPFVLSTLLRVRFGSHRYL